MDAQAASTAPRVCYDEIDIDVRRLVALLNQWPGLRTLYSCAGHGQELGAGVSEAYVCFTADTQATVRALIDAIPNWGQHATFTGFQIQVRHVGITLFRPTEMFDMPPDALVYRLAIAGTPLYHQRAQIQAIEDAVSAVVGPEVNHEQRACRHDVARTPSPHSSTSRVVPSRERTTSG